MSDAVLADLLECSDAGFWGTDPGKSDINVRVIRNGDVLASGAVRWAELPLRGFSYRELAKARLQRDDIVLTTSGYCGQVAYIDRGTDEPLCATNFVRALRPRRKLVHPRYLFWLLHSERFQTMVSPFVRGTTMKNLSFATAAARVRLPVPPIEEQRRIAAVLDKAEELQAKRRTGLGLCDALNESIFLDMFGDPVGNPKGWPSSEALGEVADVASGITKGRRTSAETRPVPYLAVANVQAGSLQLASIKEIEATEKEVVSYRLLPGDILLTEGGDPDKLGRGTIWSGELPECIHQNHVFRVRIHDQGVEPRYLNALLASKRGQRYFLRAAKQTTGIASINKTQLSRFPILRPPIELQREYLARLEAAGAARAKMRDHAAELDHLFSSLQHRAFAGQL